MIALSAVNQMKAFLPREWRLRRSASLHDDRWQTIYAMSRFKLDLVE